MIWSYFIVFALLSVALWTTGAWAAWRNRRRLVFAATGLGLAVFTAAGNTSGYWASRPSWRQSSSASIFSDPKSIPKR